MSRFWLKLQHAVLIGKLDHSLVRVLVVLQQDHELVSQDEVASSHGKLLDVLHACVELKSKLLRCNVIVVLDIKAFVEHKHVTSTIIVLLVFAVPSIVLVVVTNDVLLTHRVILPHARIDTHNRLPLFGLISLAN